MKRRDMVCTCLALGSVPMPAWTQPVAGKVWRIGYLAQDGPREWFARLAHELRVLGYEDGKNMAVSYKLALGRPGRLDALAEELVAEKVDVIVAVLNFEVQAASRATRTIPIVFQFGSAPVETGLIASLARPGGNATGTTTSTPQMTTKMVESLRDAVPTIKRLAILSEPDYPGMALYIEQAELACAAFGIKSTSLFVRRPEDLELALQEIARNPPDAINLAMTGAILSNVQRIIEFAARHRLPAHYSIKSPVQRGGLMSYSPNFAAMAKRNAWMIDRILKGTQPTAIPVEEPAEFELTINIKTANALGITIPQSMLLRATEVIR